MDDEELKDRIRKLESQVDDLQNALDKALMVLSNSDNLGIDAINIEQVREELV